MSNILKTINNNLIIGRAAYHKEKLIIPYIRECILNNQNIVVLDSKKALLKKSGKYLSDSQYSIISIDINKPMEGSLWNPLLVPYNEYQRGDRDECISELYNIATNIMADDIKVMGKDPYWDNAAIDYFVGLSLILFTEADNESQINIENVYRMAKHGSEKYGSNTYIKEYVAQLDSNPYRIDDLLQTIITAPSETKASIESVFYQKLSRVIRYVSFFNASSKDSIDIERLLHEKTAIFISYTEDRTTELQYIKVFLSQLSHMIVKKNENNRGDFPFHFIFSNFLSLGYINEFERMITSNSKNGNFFLIDLDSFSNAERLYGDNFSEYLISACQGIIVLPSNEIETLNKVNQLYELLACDKKNRVSPFYLPANAGLAIMHPNEPEVIQINILDYEDEYKMPKVNHEAYQIVEFDINGIVKERKKQQLLKEMNKFRNEDSKKTMQVIPYVGLEGETIVQSNLLSSGAYGRRNSIGESDELMKEIEQRIEQAELIENLNRYINNKI